MALVAVMIAGAWAIVQLQTQTAIGPILTQNQVSIQDRNELRGQINESASRINAVESNQKSMEAATSAKLTEIETQFRAADQIRNIQTASTMRFVSLLWKQSFGEPFPTQMYYPSISQP